MRSSKNSNLPTVTQTDTQADELNYHSKYEIHFEPQGENASQSEYNSSSANGDGHNLGGNELSGFSTKDQKQQRGSFAFAMFSNFRQVVNRYKIGQANRRQERLSLSRPSE